MVRNSNDPIVIFIFRTQIWSGLDFFSHLLLFNTDNFQIIQINFSEILPKFIRINHKFIRTQQKITYSSSDQYFFEFPINFSFISASELFQYLAPLIDYLFKAHVTFIVGIIINKDVITAKFAISSVVKKMFLINALNVRSKQLIY